MMKKFSVVRKKKKKKKSRTLDKWLFGEDLKPEKVDVELELIKADQPVNLEEFIQNPKKTPFLLSFLNGNVYHQVLLFLLEFEQHKVLPLVAREIHMKRIYNKFINPESSTEILSCLKLSGHTVRQMADSSIDSTLEIMAIRAQEILSHDCMPEFRQSPEHLQMLIETQHDRFIPMETLLEKPRAAHYFLLFLMQSRQHFELYFYLHVQYVLKPLSEVKHTETFWDRATLLRRRAARESEAITHSTQAEIKAVEKTTARAVEESMQAFVKAQQEIFLVLLSTWYPRFLKSLLYQNMIQDSVLQFDTKLYSSPRLGFADPLDLGSIIRQTDLPDGLDIHYRPHFEMDRVRLTDVKSPIDFILSFSCTTQGELVVQKVLSKDPDTADEMKQLLQPFLVPDGRYTLESNPPKPYVVPVIGPDRTWFALSYIRYEQCDSSNWFIASGISAVSKYPLIDTLRRLVVSYVDANHLIHDETSLEELLETQIDESDQIDGAPSPRRSLFEITSPSQDSIGWENESKFTHIDFSLQPLFQCFRPSQILRILVYAMLERNIIFISKYHTLLTLCAESIRCLLYPLTWCHIYTPVLPKQLLSVLQCPAPFMVGLLASYAVSLPKAVRLIIDLDHQTLEGWSIDNIQLPRAFRIAEEKLDGLLYDCDASQWSNTREFPQDRIREIFFELIQTLVKTHETTSLVVGDSSESVVIFDRKKFLEAFPDREHEFLQQFVQTQAFSELISLRILF